MEMSIEEHIAQLKKLKSFHNGSYGASISFAIETMRKYQKIFDKYEILTASFEDSDSPEVRSKKVDDFCIDTMRGLLGEYYADKVEQELKDASN